jgi:hypothetical protein
MNISINSWKSLEALLEELERELPPGVHFLGPLVGNRSRICDFYADDGLNGKRPNLVECDPDSVRPAKPFVVGVDLCLPTRGRCCWIYTVNLVIDDFLTTDEVRTKIYTAASRLAARDGSYSGMARQSVAGKKMRVN